MARKIESKEERIINNLINQTIRYMQKHGFTGTEVKSYQYGLNKKIKQCSVVVSIEKE